MDELAKLEFDSISKEELWELYKITREKLDSYTFNYKNTYHNCISGTSWVKDKK